MIRVGVIDDQSLVRDGLVLILDAEPDLSVVLEGSSGQDLLDALDAGHAVDVVLLDLRMPDVDGLTTLARLARRPTRPAVLVVTTFDHDRLVLDAIAAGAAGYLVKRGRRHELVAAVRAVAAGRPVLGPEATAAVVARVRKDPGPAADDLGPYGLTPRETDILRLVGNGMTNDEIAAHLTLSHHTVKTHLTHVLAKTDSRDRVQAALLAVRSGLSRGR